MALGLALLPAAAGQGRELPHYALSVDIEPHAHRLSAEVVVDLPDARAGTTVDFLLASSLSIVESSPALIRLEENGADDVHDNNGLGADPAPRRGIDRYRVRLPPAGRRLKLRYRGLIDFALTTQGEEYTRGFRTTPGRVGPEGIYLAVGTLWYPYFNDDLITFTLKARVPPGWHLISQGEGSSRDDEGNAWWDCAAAMDGIYLVGGPLTRYARSTADALAEVYLREPEQGLAVKYLDATARYLEMYRNLIGLYPYSKFALVENFWESGYGMPSFTLLGSRIIRFPFILTSSYPHEILQNWWGNSVLVDYESGNWSEGLTAYMADHLIKEQQGRGAEYRRDTLKKYRDFVKQDRDFPLSEFRSRHSTATEAVGYGKTLMGFHMLRLRLGDEAFRQALQDFYRKQRGRKASFGDLKSEFEAVSGQDLSRFFREWVTLSGAADLALANVRVITTGGEGFRIRGTLLQKQPQGPFELDVPLAVTTVSGTVVDVLRTAAADTRFEIRTADQPVLLSLDPAFDVFRLLDARETAPSIGQVFAETVVTAVLPSGADEATRAAYERLVRSWQSPLQAVEVVLDSGVDTLPADRGVWLLGAGNRIAAQLFADDPLARARPVNGGVSLPGGRLAFGHHSTVITARHPDNVAKAVGWITVDPASAFEGMARKLPHYGKYSYLVFEGEEPLNVLKGEWIVTDSPLLVDLRPEAERTEALTPIELPKRRALTE